MASPSTTRGKVVLVPFPFDDLSATKLRPAVCLTEPIGTNRHVVVDLISVIRIKAFPNLCPSRPALPVRNAFVNLSNFVRLLQSTLILGRHRL